jgi:tetratricopeptide (TPR) repeat protein
VFGRITILHASQRIWSQRVSGFLCFRFDPSASGLGDACGLFAFVSGNVETPLLDAVFSFEQAVRLDPKFTLAYCALAQAHDLLYFFGYDQTPERRASADEAINSALGLQSDLPEVHLARGYHLYLSHYADYEQARVELTIARRGLPNDSRAIMLEAMIDRSEGHWEKAIQKFNQAIARDPRNPVLLAQLAYSLVETRQFRAAEQAYAKLIGLPPDQPTLKLELAGASFCETGDDSVVWSAIAALPPSIANDSDVFAWRLNMTLIDRDWAQAKELIVRQAIHCKTPCAQINGLVQRLNRSPRTLFERDSC